MEVLLRKTKITQSILKQTQNIDISNMQGYEVLGWCYFKDVQVILFYSGGENKLRQYPMWKELRETSYPVYERSNGTVDPARYDLQVVFTPKLHKYYSYTSENLRGVATDNLRSAKSEAFQNGQIFI